MKERVKSKQGSKNKKKAQKKESTKKGKHEKMCPKKV